VNASPDLRSQIESFPPLTPRPTQSRQSPITGVILTSAEIDASLGLLLLRESQPLVVFATEPVRRVLTEDNSLFAVLQREPDQIRWVRIAPGRAFELDSTAIRCTPVSTHGAFPGFVRPERAAQFDASGAVIGLILEEASRRVAFFPGAPRVASEWFDDMAGCDAILFDGTFWSDDELIRVKGRGKTGRQMGHLPVGDAGGTLEQFSGLATPRKIFIHINNTNPMLDEESAEYHRVRASGWELAFDGMEICL